jgi:hypothetical protein
MRRQKICKGRKVRRLSDIVDLIYACGLEVRYIIMLVCGGTKQGLDDDS